MTFTKDSAPPSARSTWPRAAARSITWSSTTTWKRRSKRSSRSSDTNVREVSKAYDRSTQERRNREQGWRPLQADRIDPEAHARADGRRAAAGRADARHDRPGDRDPGDPAGQNHDRLRRQWPGCTG